MGAAYKNKGVAAGAIIDGTGLTTTVPITIKNGKNLSGVEAQVTGTAPSGFVLRDASAVLQGALGLAVGANDWVSGSGANDTVVVATNRLLMVGGPNAGGGFKLSNPQGTGGVDTYVASTHNSGVDINGGNYCLVNVGAGGVSITSPAGQGTAFVSIIGGNANTAANAVNFEVQSFNWNPASGALYYRGINLNYTVNQTGSASGTATGIFLNATQTALLGTHNLVDLQVGTVSKFRVDSTGLISQGLAQIAVGGGSAATLGTIGGSGPTAAAMSGWEKVNINGNVRFRPLWA